MPMCGYYNELAYLSGHNYYMYAFHSKANEVLNAAEVAAESAIFHQELKSPDVSKNVLYYNYPEELYVKFK